MPKVNEQLDKLWDWTLPEAVRRNAKQLRQGLVEMEKGNGVKNAGVRQTDIELTQTGSR